MRSTQSWIVMFIISALLSAICSRVESSSNEADKIVKLPGQPDVSFQQYAGYVTVDATQGQERQLFYYFVEAETNSSSKPLVLWLNGGPGCSSIGAGAFTEHGPFRPNDKGANLVRNDYSWNKEANMIYLESPAGVGFSYSANQSFYDLVNDTITANDNLVFLQQWLLKFPEYKKRDFYITGESYAGHYVPQLAQLFLESGTKDVNLKAIAIGNPLLEFNTDFNGEGKYYWSHSLISDHTYRLVNTICNTSQLRRESTSDALSPPCKIVATRLAAEIPDRNSLDKYDVTSDVCLSYRESGEPLAAAFHPYSALRSTQATRRNLKSGESVDACTGDDTGAYLNRKDVQDAIHAKLVNIPGWNSCSYVVNYDYDNLEIPTIGVVGSLVDSGIRVLVYSGDQDAVLPFIGTRVLVNRLAKKMRLNSTVSYKSWFDDDKQVGGWTQVYGENKLEFATIRGASHLAPYSSPKRSLALFARFIAGNSLAS
ncbi:Serine carboxypeptidase-like 45 [Linum grandiflorum]